MIIGRSGHIEIQIAGMVVNQQNQRQFEVIAGALELFSGDTRHFLTGSFSGHGNTWDHKFEITGIVVVDDGHGLLQAVGGDIQLKISGTFPADVYSQLQYIVKVNGHLIKPNM
jgi:hypothetical protein